MRPVLSVCIVGYNMRSFLITAVTLIAGAVALPGYSGSCPTLGEMQCRGTGFVTCDNSGWVYRPCGPGMTCYKIPETGGVYCGYPAGKVLIFWRQWNG